MPALTNRYEDDDASHLASGMTRVGYDADSERYTFREGNDLWLGEPGSFYGGKLKWAGKAPDAEEHDNDTSSSNTEHTDSSEHKGFLKLLREDAARECTHIHNKSPQNGADDLWGVPVASISDTSAQPPDSPKGDMSIHTHVRKAKKAATLAANALSVFNRRLRKSKP